MNINSINQTNFNGVKLLDSSYNHAKYVKNILNKNNVYVYGHKTFYANNDFMSKKRVIDYVRYMNNFSEYESGFIFLPWSGESWIVSNKVFEQKIKNILDKYKIKSEINIGI